MALRTPLRKTAYNTLYTPEAARPDHPSQLLPASPADAYVNLTAIGVYSLQQCTVANGHDVLEIVQQPSAPLGVGTYLTIWFKKEESEWNARPWCGGQGVILEEVVAIGEYKTTFRALSHSRYGPGHPPVTVCIVALNAWVEWDQVWHAVYRNLRSSRYLPTITPITPVTDDADWFKHADGAAATRMHIQAWFALGGPRVRRIDWVSQSE